MINAQTFAKWMRVLAERIGKPLSPDTGAVYYATLSAELDTAQFETAMQRIFRDHQYATWPSPKAIIDGIRPTQALEATAAWTRISETMRLLPGGASRSEIHNWLVRDVGETATATFEAIGGRTRLSAANDWRLDEMRSEFLDRMPDMARLNGDYTTALPPAVRAYLADGDEEPEELSP